jgi:hypothetical protein
MGARRRRLIVLVVLRCVRPAVRRWDDVSTASIQTWIDTWKQDPRLLIYERWPTGFRTPPWPSTVREATAQQLGEVPAGDP